MVKTLAKIIQTFLSLHYLCNTKKTVQRYFIYLAYDGTAYHGWQIQPNGASVQECLMKALSTLLRREVEVVGAGRTDAGGACLTDGSSL